MAALVTCLAGIGPDDEARQLAREVLAHFTETVPKHHEDEERHVFLKLMAAADAQTAQGILRLQQDHRWLDQDWLELLPAHRCRPCGRPLYDLAELRAGSEVLIALSHDHIALEESVIYPQARTRAGPRELREMGREIAACRRAGRHATSP